MMALPTSSPARRAGTAPRDRSERRHERAVRAVGRLRRDLAHWCARVYQIRTKTQELQPLRLNPVQLAIEAAEAEQLRTTGRARLFVLKARQGGVTTYEQAKALHMIWSRQRVDALTMSDKRDRTDKIFGITRRALLHFPPSLLPTVGARAVREVSFPGLDSHFFTETAGAGEAARSLTLARLHCSEFAYFDDPAHVLGAAVPALVPQGSVVVLETTASGFDSPAHEFWRDAEARGYRPLFFPWWECDPVHYRLPLEAPDELGTLDEDEHVLVARRGLDLEQIKWRRAQIAELEDADFRTEYAEDADSCWVAAGGMFYDAALLRALLQRAPEPIETHLNGTLQIFSHVQAGERTIGGCDTAEGGGGDRSAWIVRAFPSLRLIATWADAAAVPTEGAALLNSWSRTRFNLPFWIVEKNMHGITWLRNLRDVHAYPLDKLYHRETLDSQFDGPISDRIGWATTAQSKPLMLDAGRELLQGAKDGTVPLPPAAVVRDALGVRRGVAGTAQLTGKDLLVSDMLLWLGREACARSEMGRPGLAYL